jgi:hypothetical protein
MQTTTEGTYRNFDVRYNRVEVTRHLSNRLEVGSDLGGRLGGDEGSRGKGSDDGEESHDCGFVNDGDDVEILKRRAGGYGIKGIARVGAFITAKQLPMR